MKIYILRQDMNEYDQPPNNLAAIWTKKPDVNMIMEAMELGTSLVDLSESALIAVVSVLRGDKVRFAESDFKLECIEEGKF